MGRTYGVSNAVVAGASESSKPATSKSATSTKTRKKTTKTKSGMAGGVVLGLVLGVAVSVGGYFGYTFMTGESPASIISVNNGLSADSTYAEVFDKYGIALNKDFLQSSYTNSEASSNFDVAACSIDDVKLDESSISKLPAGYTSNKSETDSLVTYSMTSSNDNVSVGFENKELVTANYQIVNSSTPVSGSVVTICGVKNTATLDEVLTQLGKPSYASVSDTFVTDGRVSISLTYISGNSNFTISFSDMSGIMQIISMSYSNL